MSNIRYGMNRFDHIFFINLDHRKDRLEHIFKQLDNMMVDFQKVERIEAHYMKFFGILGCGKSHIKALETFLEKKSGDNCLILEDDFTFCLSKPIVDEMIEEFFNKKGNNFDVFMLSCNVLQKEHDTSNIWRIKCGQTLSGYCVSRQYAPILLENFKKGVEMLEKIGFSVHEYCVDIHIQQLQPNDRWFFMEPAIGKQIESYSDIEQCNRNYGC